MKLRNYTALFLAFVMLFLLLPVQALAADNTFTITNGDLTGLPSVTLSEAYSGAVYTTGPSVTTTDNVTWPAGIYTFTLPNAAERVTLTYTPTRFASLNNIVFCSVEGTTDGAGQVQLPIAKTYSGTCSWSITGFDEAGPIFNWTEDILPKDYILSDNTEEITMTAGNGTSKYLAVFTGTVDTSGSDFNPSANTGSKTYELSALYQFQLQAEVDITPSLTKDLSRNGHLCTPGGTLAPLSVEATAAAIGTLSYQWYSGESEDNVTTPIENATSASYPPPTDQVGIFYYKVTVTNTLDGNSKSVTSSVARVVVRETEERTFSLDTCNGFKLETRLDDHIYYYSFPTAAIASSSPFINSAMSFTGTLPDGVQITGVWAGAPYDEHYDLTASGALTVDDITGRFTVSVKDNTYSNNQDSNHVFGKCYYLELTGKDGKEVYTVVIDNDFQMYDASINPKVVQLVDESSGDASILTDFQVTDLQSADTTTSIVRGTLHSDKPVVLRAQVQNGGEDLIGKDATYVSTRYFWNKSQQSWVLVNGERLPAGGFFSGNEDENMDFSSPAFTLKKGLNVVEVYTNSSSFRLDPNKSHVGKGAGLGEVYYDSLGRTTGVPAYMTSSVIYLIDYDGESAQTLPSETQSTELASVTAVRYGDNGTKMEACPFVWNEAEKAYNLYVPETYRSGDINALYYFHSVLLSMRTAAGGTSVSIVSDYDKLIVGEQVGSSVFLDMDVFRDAEDPRFTIHVVSADGSATTDYPVKIVYASSSTAPVVTLSENVELDTTFTGDTYSYYLDYPSAGTTGQTMSFQLPDGSTATVNGTAYTSGDVIALDPKEDFYRLTITAEDNYTVTNYYFVTRYKDTGKIPYRTVPQSTKDKAKTLLSGWYENVNTLEYFPSYWNVFMVKATGTKDGDFDFNGKYVEDPARHTMKQATDWAACIMEIVMLGENPYSFPRIVDGKRVEDFNYVEAMIKQGGGAFANNVWYHWASQAAGAPRRMLRTMRLNALERTFDLDTRGWSVAALSGDEPTKEMVRYIDSLHDVQDTSGTYTSLWTNQGYHSSGSGGNPYTIGCAISAIVSGGGDIEKLFAVGENTPLDTIQKVMFNDGRFTSGTDSKGTFAKDMIVGLGDVLHESNVMVRYMLTADKYDSLIAKAKTLGIDTSSMPATFTQTTACGKAYYDLYDAVYAALVAAGRTTEAKEMRPDVIWGMPHEAFADEVNKMPAASALTFDDLDDLEKLIAQYEAMDDSSKKAIASDVLSKYQALVKRGLALKAEGTTADSDKISKIYDEIIALPAASEITESDIEATLAKVTEIEQEIGTLSEEEKSLLMWMDNSLLQKLEDIRKAAPKQDITVSFTLYGDTRHEIKTDDYIHTYFFDGTSLDPWITTTNVTVPEGSTVLTVFEKVLGEKGFEYVNRPDNSYISSITNDANVTLAEKNNTLYSGWMYLVNDEYANVGLNAKQVKNGDRIVWHFTDDYRLEHSGMAYTPERVIEYVANLYDVSTPDKANAAYSKISTEYQTQVSELRANRKSVRDVIALIDAITDWNVQKDVANDRSAVTKWVQDKLNKELEGKLDGVTLDVAIGIYRITPATDEANGKYTAEITVSKGSGSLGATSKLKKAGVIKAPSADPAEGNKAAVDAATAMLEKTSFIYASKDVNTEAAAKAAVERQIGALFGDADISYEVTMTGFTAAVDGTLWSDPTNGSFSFTVKLTKGKGDSYAEANVSLTGTITAASKPFTPVTPVTPSKPSKPKDDTAKPDASKFVDVSKNNWYFDAVQYVLENGLMNGTSANEFSPNANTTRGMIVTILARLDGVDTSGSSPWYAAGRTWAMNNSVSDGTNMDGKITREQLAAMLYRYAKLKGYDVSASADISAYTDASSVSSWAKEAMQWAVGAGLINGRTATTLAPQGNATRAEVAAILMRVEQKLAK